MVKHTQTIRWLFPTNILSVFDHFVGLGLKGLIPKFFSRLSNELPSFISVMSVRIQKLKIR